jgi:hypothetical protein
VSAHGLFGIMDAKDACLTQMGRRMQEIIGWVEDVIETDLPSSL